MEIDNKIIKKLIETLDQLKKSIILGVGNLKSNLLQIGEMLLAQRKILQKYQ